MKTKHNSRQIKQLLRVIDTLDGFELVICGYQSFSLFREMRKLVQKNCRAKSIDVVELDVSAFSEVRDFAALLREKAGKKKGYRVFNITGMEQHVKAGKKSSFLNQLNLLRDRLAADYPYGFFYWMPEGLVEHFALDAPDLWAWRNTVFVFEDDQGSTVLELTPIKILPEENYENYTDKEKQRQLDSLNGLIVYTRNLPDSQGKEIRLAAFYKDLGTLFYAMENFDTALLFYKQCIEAAPANKSSQEIAVVYNLMALTFQAKGDNEQALKYYHDSLNILTRLKDQEKIASIYNNMGVIFQANQDFEKALEYYLKSKGIFSDIQELHGLAATGNNIGTLRAINRDFKTAAEAFSKSLDILNKRTDDVNAHIILNNISHVYFARGDYDAALDSLIKSSAILNRLGDKTRFALSMLKLAALCKEADRKEENIEWLRKALHLKEQINSPKLSTAWDNFFRKYKL
ncbi:MAG: tetratricopeptide repeat protein [bacterium]|nr:tetratricopeptide repeat protein [bacterium]